MLVYKQKSTFSHCADLLAEVSRREKEANIKPDPDIDVYMKVREVLLFVRDMSYLFIWPSSLGLYFILFNK